MEIKKTLGFFYLIRVVHEQIKLKKKIPRIDESTSIDINENSALV